MPTPDPLAEKRDQIERGMRAAHRWHDEYRRDLDSMPESVLDSLLAYYGEGRRGYVW